MTTPENAQRKLEQRAVRAFLHPLLHAALAELKKPAREVPAQTFLGFLSELALAAQRYRKGSKEQRRRLRRIVLQPTALDAEFLAALLDSYLTPPGPSSPALLTRKKERTC